MEMIDFLKRSVGLMLSGDTSEEQVWIVYGVGANGKSKFIKTLHDLLGNYAQQAPSALFMSKKNTGGATPELARIKGARFVSCVETSDGKRLDEELIKQLSGRDKIAARQLYKDYFEFEPECKMWLVTNHKPIIQGTDNGIWRRIYLIPFDVVIPEEEQDKRLGEKLRSELPGILNWCIQGFNEWYRQGLHTPQKIQEATKEYRSEMDKLGTFLHECCDLGKEFKSSLEELYVTYLEWCKVNEEFSNNKRTFSRHLKERGFLQRKSTGGRKPFWGLRLKVAEVAQVANFPQKSPYKKHFSPNEFREKTATTATSATILPNPMSNTNKVIVLEDEWDEGTF